MQSRQHSLTHLDSRSINGDSGGDNDICFVTLYRVHGEPDSAIVECNVNATTLDMHSWVISVQHFMYCGHVLGPIVSKTVQWQCHTSYVLFADHCHPYLYVNGEPRNLTNVCGPLVHFTLYLLLHPMLTDAWTMGNKWQWIGKTNTQDKVSSAAPLVVLGAERTKSQLMRTLESPDCALSRRFVCF